jgi:hypothetical protein
VPVVSAIILLPTQRSAAVPIRIGNQTAVNIRVIVKHSSITHKINFGVGDTKIVKLFVESSSESDLHAEIVKIKVYVNGDVVLEKTASMYDIRSMSVSVYDGTYMLLYE